MLTCAIPIVTVDEISVTVSSIVRQQMPLVLLWWTLSSGLSLFNKKVLGKGTEGDLGFPAPLFLTACQFFIESLLASLWRHCNRPLAASTATESPRESTWSSLHEYEIERPSFHAMSENSRYFGLQQYFAVLFFFEKNRYLSKYMVAGVSTGLDIGLSNWVSFDCDF